MPYTVKSLSAPAAYDFFEIAQRCNFAPSGTEPNRLKHHRLFFIKTGYGTLQIDDQSFTLAPNVLLLLAKGQVYRFDPASLFFGYELAFDDFFWEKSPASANNCKAILFNNAAHHQLIPLSQADATELESLTETLYQEYQKTEYINKPDVLAAYLKIIMIKIANVDALLTDAFDGFEKQVYRQFMALITQHYGQSHDVLHYAEQLNMTPRKLTDLCKRHTGQGAKELINAHLIIEAKRALQFSAATIKEVSFQLNFSTPEQFSHFFKKHTLSSPQQYRSGFVNIGR